MNEIYTRAKEILPEMIENRRYLHQNPEVGFDLPKTTAYVAKKLAEMGITSKEIFKSGLIADIGDPSSDRVFLLRADMDALTMAEITNLPFRSTNQYAHMCGHDLHTAMLLGAGKLLKERENQLKGRVRLMFQPAEEFGMGAKAMIEAGALEEVKAAMALHVAPELNTGELKIKPGVATSSINAFMLEIKGRGGHSSSPHTAVDPLMIATEIYQSLNQLIGREIDPLETAVLTVGKLSGGTAFNVIPDSAYMEFGLRCYNPKVRAYLVGRIYDIVEQTTTMLRGSHRFYGQHFTPSVINDQELLDIIRPGITNIIGNKLSIDQKPFGATEDFSRISEKVPSLLCWLGAGYPENYSLHNPRLDLDENAMPYGTSILVSSAIEYLHSKI